MSDIKTENTPSLYAVIPFYGATALAFLILCIMLFFSIDAFGGHFFNPKLLALIHIAALGWGTMIIFGAVYQLLPVIFETNLYSAKLSVLSFIFLLPGTILLVYNFWIFSMGFLMIAGASLIIAAVGLYVTNVMLTARNSKKNSIQKKFMIASAHWLFLTALIGLLLVINSTYPIFKQDQIQILRLHAHAGVVGWFLLLIIGVGSRLFPMFLLGKSTKDKYLLVAYYLINAGLVAFLIDGFIFGITLRYLIYSIIISTGIVFFLLYIVDVFKNRFKKKLDYQMRQSMLSVVFLLLAIIDAHLMLLKTSELSCSLVYGTLIFMGWITSLILGMTTKTLPFIVWNNIYKEQMGKSKVPMPNQIYFDFLIKWQFFIYLAGIIFLIAGIKTNIEWLLQIAFSVMLIVAIIYNVNVFKIIFHKPNFSK